MIFNAAIVNSIFLKSFHTSPSVSLQNNVFLMRRLELKSLCRCFHHWP